MKLNILRKAANLALLALGLAMVSCSTDSADLEIDATTDERELITFTVSSDTQTRGSIMGDADFTSFVLYAVDTQTGSLVIDGAEFTLDESTNKFTTDKSFYWTNNPITFCAYAVNTAEEVENGVEMKINGTDIIFTYDMPSDVTAQPDLQIATKTLTSGTVSLQFTRAFALVQFKAFGADGYSIASVSMSNFATSGTYSMDSDAAWAWDNDDADATSYAAGIDTSIKLTDSEALITNETGYMMVLPQTTSGVKILAKDACGNSKEYTVDADWKAGYLYTYTVDSENVAADSSMDFEVTTPSADLTLTTGDSVTLGLASAEDVTIVSYKSSNEAVATVDDDGVITTVGAGTATITVTLTVNDYIVELTITIEVSESESGSGDGSGDDSGSTGGNFDYSGGSVNGGGALVSGNYVTSDGTITTDGTASNVIGLIFHVDEAGQYALAVSANYCQSGYAWSNNSDTLLGCSNSNNGYYNTSIYAGHCTAASTIWNKGTVAALQSDDDVSKGHWYVPARYEIEKMADEFGDYKPSYTTYNKEWYNIMTYCGLSSIVYYWSSTENGASSAYKQSNDATATSSIAKSTTSYKAGWYAVIRF